MTAEKLAGLVADNVLDVPDFPQPGVMFKDLMPLFANGTAFRQVTDGIVEHYGAGAFDVVAGVEARGFVVAAAIAYATGTGVVPIRKAGKLPRAAYAASYARRDRRVAETHEGSATVVRGWLAATPQRSIARLIEMPPQRATTPPRVASAARRESRLPSISRPPPGPWK